MRQGQHVRVACYSCLTMKNHPEVSLLRECFSLILYGIAFSIVMTGLYPFLLDIFARWTAPHTWQPSINVALHMNPMIATPLMISVVTCLFYLRHLRYDRKRLPWVAIRMTLVAIMIVLFVATFSTISEGRKILDRKILDALAPLHIGMPRSAVEALVLQSNHVALSTHTHWLLHGEGIEEFMTQRLERARRGETGMLVFDRSIPLGLFSQEHGREQAETQVTRRYYAEGLRTLYTLDLRFDSQDRLKSVGYKREAIVSGSGTSCEVLFQRPTTTPPPCASTSGPNI